MTDSTLKNKLRAITIHYWTVPLALFILVVAGFGLLILGLGFYQDDWYLIWMGQRYGPEIYRSFFAGSRPFLAGIYMLTTELIGPSPLAWQIFALLTRWLAVLAAWWALRLLWPGRIKEVTWIAILLAIYPAFKQHFVAVVYSNTYIALAASLFSLGTMCLSIRQPRWRWLLTGLGMAASAFSLVTTEYFFGLELFRPVFLWIIFSEQQRSARERLRLVLIYWLPYLLVTGLFLIWRVFFFTSYMYESRMAAELSRSPVTGLINVFLTLVQDAFEASTFAWLQTFEFARQADPALRQFLINWGIVCLVALAVGYYLLHLKSASGEEKAAPGYNPRQEDKFDIQAVGLGLYSTLIVGWPFWFAGLHVELAGGYDRFTLPYMLGAAILVVGLLELLFKSNVAKIAVISLLVGAAVLFQIRNAQTYQAAHSVQSNLFRQLVWRAPGLKPGTQLLINDIPADYTGNASMNAAMEWIYSPGEPDSSPQYALWYLPFKLGSPDLPDLNPGEHTAGSLVAYYQPPGCVQIIDPLVHQALPRLSESIQHALPLSDLAQIESEGQIAQENYDGLFGKPDQENWCYYFEKADLARQLADWQEIARLGDQAAVAGLEPNDKFSSELLPFIEGYERIGKWKEAYHLSKTALVDVPALQETLCFTWERLVENSQTSSERDQILNQVNVELGCTLPEN